MNKIYAGIEIDDVVNNYSDTLIRIAFQNTKNMADAEDIVQDVYFKLINYKDSFKSKEHLKAWLIRVTINKCKDYFRTAWFRKTTHIEETMEFLALEEQKVLDEIFLLNREDRDIVYLHYYEGYSIKEIASILNKKINTISSKMQRARKKLKVLIMEGEEDNG